jgi:histidine ammonia-lyase
MPGVSSPPVSDQVGDRHPQASDSDLQILLTGRQLTPDALAAIARDGTAVQIEETARERMARAHALVRAAAAGPTPVYGVTTGLGARVGFEVHDSDGEEFSLRTIRGRATAVGPPLSRELTRAAMAVRLNGLCAGGAGASVAVADAFAAALNRGLHPSIPRSGSLGASDLCLMAHVGLGLIGEGECELHGERLPGPAALQAAGLTPLALGPKDGLAICSSSAVSIGAAGLALVDAFACLEELQIAAALSMEGFRASLSPLDPRVVQARPAPGQEWAAAGLRTLLHGGALEATGRPGAGSSRRLQDPLSFRCASQIHGSAFAALELLAEVLAPDLNGAADNPLVLADDGEILSNGNFQGPALALALDTVAIAIAQIAHASAARQARLVTPRLSGLQANLVAQDPDSPTRSGAAPLGKAALALVLEIRHRAAPLAIGSMVEADGVEDDTTGAAQGALRLLEQLERLRELIAIELLIGAQAADLVLQDGGGPLGAGTESAHRAVRERLAPLGEDRPLGPEAMRLRDELLASGELRARVGARLGAPA